MKKSRSAKITDDWRDAIKFQEGITAMMSDLWIQGLSAPSIVFMQAIVTHDNLHLFSSDKLGETETLLYPLDNFHPSNQDPQQLLQSLTRLYSIDSSTIETTMQALEDVVPNQRERARALFYVLMQDIGKDIEEYLEDYISVLLKESKSHFMVLACESETLEDDPCFHVYLEMEDGRVRIHNVVKKVVEGSEDVEIEHVMVESDSVEDVFEILPLGPFFGETDPDFTDDETLNISE